MCAPPLARLNVFVLAAALAGCGSSSAPTAASNLPSPPSASFATRADLDFCIAETNRYRQMANKSALTGSAAAEAFALNAAISDHRSGTPHAYFGSQAVNGAENEVLRAGLAVVGPNARAAISISLSSFWAEGPGGGHYQNLISNRSDVGCGVFSENGLVTVVQEFR